MYMYMQTYIHEFIYVHVCSHSKESHPEKKSLGVLVPLGTEA